MRVAWGASNSSAWELQVILLRTKSNSVCSFVWKCLRFPCKTACTPREFLPDNCQQYHMKLESSFPGRQRANILLRLLGTTSSDTCIGLKSSTKTRIKEASPNLPGGFPLVTCRNHRFWLPVQTLPAFAGKFTWETTCLRSPQVNLPAPLFKSNLSFS